MRLTAGSVRYELGWRVYGLLGDRFAVVLTRFVTKSQRVGAVILQALVSASLRRGRAHPPKSARGLARRRTSMARIQNQSGALRRKRSLDIVAERLRRRGALAGRPPQRCALVRTARCGVLAPAWVRMRAAASARWAARRACFPTCVACGATPRARAEQRDERGRRRTRISRTPPARSVLRPSLLRAARVERKETISLFDAVEAAETIDCPLRWILCSHPSVLESLGIAHICITHTHIGPQLHRGQIWPRLMQLPRESAGRAQGA